MKYLYLAKKRGARIAVVNPLREPGLERYWVPSSVESAVFGTKITDEFFGVHTGGDVGVPQRRHEGAARDSAASTAGSSPNDTLGFDGFLEQLEEEPFDRLEALSGATRADMERFARMYMDAKSAVLVWSMGITQHTTGVDNVKAIVNLALARGNVGRPGAGLMPIRGHSGVQGGAEMGCYATAFPGGVAVDGAQRRRPRRASGASRCRRRAGSTRARWSRPRAAVTSKCCGPAAATSSTCCPRPTSPAPRSRARRCASTRTSCSRTRCSSNRGRRSCCLPAATRYEQAGGGTSTTTERRVAFSPEIDGPKVGEARSRVRDLPRRRAAGASRTGRPHRVRRRRRRSARRSRASSPRTRASRRCARPATRSRSAALACAKAASSRRPTAAPASASSCPPDPTCRPAASCSRPDAASSSTPWCGRTSTRSPAPGATRCCCPSPTRSRSASVPATRCSCGPPHGEMRARAHIAPIRAGNVQAFFPEANVLLAPNRRDPISGVPDYNAVVEVVPIA